MNIAIIGTGNVGAALGSALSNVGHKVVFGVRNLDSPKTRKAAEAIPNAIFDKLDVAIASAETIIIATPPEAVLDLVDLIKENNSKIIIDTTNSIRTKPEPYPTAFHALKDLAKTEHVVKCFNSTGFENMKMPVYHNIGIDMFAAGDSKLAKQVAEKLALEIGFGACYDFGGDDKVELLEKFALSWINLAIMQGHGRNLAFKLLKR